MTSTPGTTTELSPDLSPERADLLETLAKHRYLLTRTVRESIDGRTSMG